MANREFLQLADKYSPERNGIAGWYVSEKLDGMRALWDGGITTGLLVSDVPWANKNKKDHLKQEPIATGLWSRYGNVIHAPRWFISKLPLCALDGELWLDRQSFQTLSSIVKQHNPDSRWKNIKYVVLDIVPYDYLFASGRINNPNFKIQINCSEIDSWLTQHLEETSIRRHKGMSFTNNIAWMRKNIQTHRNLVLLQQQQLPYSTPRAHEQLEEMLSNILDIGGEGLVIRKPESIWTPKRSKDCLKLKPFKDDEAKVIGYVWGRLGKLDGLMGALVVIWQGKKFELSGFTDQERQLKHKVTGGQASTNRYPPLRTPGESVRDNIENPLFPIGTQVTFRYRELSDSGIPKEARYWRKK